MRSYMWFPVDSSWVLDWRPEANVHRPPLFINGASMRILSYFNGSIDIILDMILLHGHGYLASGKSEAWADFQNNFRILKVHSFVLGSVETVCPT